MTVLTASDFADTGQWRLLIRIFQDGINAYLENTHYDDVAPQLLFEEKWEDEADLLKKIETAVYQNPRVLDDFAAKIIVYDIKTLFVPSSIIDEEEGKEEEIYSYIYESEPEDIFSDKDREITALYNPGKGIKSFVLRTFPGARITSNLMEKVRSLRKDNSKDILHIFKRGEQTDFILLNKENLVSASTHERYLDEDILFIGLNLINVYGMNSKEIDLSWHGRKPETEDLKKFLYKHFNRVEYRV